MKKYITLALITGLTLSGTNPVSAMHFLPDALPTGATLATGAAFLAAGLLLDYSEKPIENEPTSTDTTFKAMQINMKKGFGQKFDTYGGDALQLSTYLSAITTAATLILPVYFSQLEKYKSLGFKTSLKCSAASLSLSTLGYMYQYVLKKRVQNFTKEKFMEQQKSKQAL